MNKGVLTRTTVKTWYNLIERDTLLVTETARCRKRVVDESEMVEEKERRKRGDEEGRRDRGEGGRRRRKSGGRRRRGEEFMEFS